MKLKSLFLVIIFFGIISCDNDDTDYEYVKVAVPEVMSKADFRSSVKVEVPIEIKEAGKIYAYSNYIFINEVDKGIHVLDNTNPETPVAKAFINIPGNIDIAIKDNLLYADSVMDLVVFDISDINNITKTFTLEDMFIPIINYDFPVGVWNVNYDAYDSNTQLIVGWKSVIEKRKVDDQIDYHGHQLFNNGIATNTGASAESNVGTGGSLARFQIVNDYLYTVEDYEMKTFNISNLSQPFLENSFQAGWNIETMFHADNYLYLGSTRGMYIYSLENPSVPEYVSDFTHWEGCDPVVVDGDYAYLTLRGGNICGQDESVLEVIDIKDKSAPTLKVRYQLENPYGLGIKGNTLFVCDGTSGLKLFNKENPLDITLISKFENIQSKDVIPLNDKLIMIGDNVLYQYNYVEGGVTLLSTYALN